MFTKSSIKWYTSIATMSFLCGGNVLMLTFSAAPFGVSYFYQQPTSVLNQILSVNYFLGFLFTIFFMLIADHYGPTGNLIVCIITSVLAVLFRLFSIYIMVHSKDTAFIFYYLSCISCMAIGNSANINTLKLSSVWFPDDLKAVGTGIATLGGALGILVANAVFPKIIISTASYGELYFATGIAALILGIGAFSALMIFYLNDWSACPRGPEFVSLTAEQFSVRYSASSASEDGKIGHSEPFITSLKRNAKSCYQLLDFYSEKNKINRPRIRGFLPLAVSYMLLLSMGFTIIVALPQITCTFGYDYSLVTIGSLLAYVLPGIFSNIITTVVAGKVKRYDRIYFTFLWFQGICMWTFTFIITTPKTDFNISSIEIIIILIFGIYGLFTSPCLPLALELCVECSYPIDAGTASGLMLLIFQLGWSFFSWGFYYFAKPIDVNSVNSDGFEVTCKIADDSLEVPEDFRNSLIFLSACFCGILAICGVVIRIPWLQRNYNEESRNQDKGHDNEVSKI